MAWIESHQQVGRHPKTKKLARLLGVSLPAAVGHIHYLWWWALDYAQDGDLSRFDSYDLKDAVHWDGDGIELMEALVESGYVDRDDEGGLHLHDWFEYAGKLAERRAKDRARKAEAAERTRKSKELHRNSDGIDAEVDGIPSVPNQTKPNLTKPNQTEPNQPPAADAAPPVPYEKIRELFNSTCLSLSKVVGINGERKTSVAARWKEHPDLDWWAAYFRKVEASAFLKGNNDRKWKAKFDWLINAANMNKVLEGNYDSGEGGENSGRHETPQRDPQQYTRGFKE